MPVDSQTDSPAGAASAPVVFIFDWALFRESTGLERDVAAPLWAEWHSIVDSDRKLGDRGLEISLRFEDCRVSRCGCACVLSGASHGAALGRRGPSVGLD